MNHDGVITYAEMLDLLDSGQAFDMTFVKADRRRGTGGEIVEVRGWAKCNSDVYDRGTISVPEGGGKSKKPNHGIHKTRNIMNLKNYRVKRKVHTRLICKFNGKQVI